MPQLTMSQFTSKKAVKPTSNKNNNPKPPTFETLSKQQQSTLSELASVSRSLFDQHASSIKINEEERNQIFDGLTSKDENKTNNDMDNIDKIIRCDVAPKCLLTSLKPLWIVNKAKGLSQMKICFFFLFIKKQNKKDKQPSLRFIYQKLLPKNL